MVRAEQALRRVVSPLHDNGTSQYQLGDDGEGEKRGSASVPDQTWCIIHIGAVQVQESRYGINEDV